MGRPTNKKIGDKFGGLEIINVIPQNKSGRHVVVECLCHHCGKKTKMNSHYLKRRNSCGCQQRNPKTWKSVGPKTMPWQLPPGEAAKNGVEYSYKRTAERRNLIYELTTEEFSDLITGDCFYCGQKETQIARGLGETSGDFFYTGIDRIDSNLGYTKDNCVSCCWMCNSMKNKHTKDNFLEHIEKIYNHNKKEQE